MNSIKTKVTRHTRQSDGIWNTSIGYHWPRELAAPKCLICGDGKLYRKNVRRMSAGVVAFGYLILIPSVFVLLSSFLLLIGSIVIWPGFVASFALGMIGFLGCLFGSLLVMRKSVLRCSRCGAVTAAS